MALPHFPADAPDPRPITAVTTTNVFCRHGCPAPAPRPDHVLRLASAHEALFTGFRPCLRCRPLESLGAGISQAQLRRAERLRPTLVAARRAGRRRARGAIALRLIGTPLGPMLGGATDGGICLLEFADRPMLPTQLEVVSRRLGMPLRTGWHPHLDRLEAALDAYFAGRQPAIDVPLVAPGSAFQERTWSALQAIPPGETICYEELATYAGRPGAQRAAGTANGANRLALVIPCHRVIRKDGDIGNYGGGRWRKAWLLDHERRMTAAPTLTS